MFATDQGRKIDPVDVHSVAVVALRTPGLRQVVVQLRNDNEGRRYYRHKLADAKPAMEAMRALKRRLSGVAYRQMTADAKRIRTGPGGHVGATLQSSAADPNPWADTSEKSRPGPAETKPRAQPNTTTRTTHSDEPPYRPARTSPNPNPTSPARTGVPNASRDQSAARRTPARSPDANPDRPKTTSVTQFSPQIRSRRVIPTWRGMAHWALRCGHIGMIDYRSGTAIAARVRDNIFMPNLQLFTPGASGGNAQPDRVASLLSRACGVSARA